jgi:hypothetical protein
MISPIASTQHHRPRNSDYIGDSDHDVLAFISNLAQQVQLHGPAAFGLKVDDLAIIIAVRDAYQTAYQRVHDPRTRTVPNTVAKNEARDEADRISRTYAQIIKNQPSHVVSDVLKVSVGVRVEKETRTAKRRPGTAPILYVGPGVRLYVVPEVTIRFRDSALATARMPREDGITHMILHGKIALQGEFSTSASSRHVVAYITRNPHIVKFDRNLLDLFGALEPLEQYRVAASEAMQRGATFPPCFLGVMFQGQWLNAKGEVGPLGQAKFFNVPLPLGTVSPMKLSTATVEAKPEQAQDVKLAA